MRSALKFLALSLAASLTLVACGSSSSSSSQTSTRPASTPASSSGEAAGVVRSASNATLGATVLVDSNGMTLYSLSGEQNGKWICTSTACTGIWHPVTAPSNSTPSGSVGSLGTVKRPDGTMQVTYKGMPLYTFTSDQKPGDAKGQGIKDVGTWSALAVGATSSSSTPAPAATHTETAPASSGGKYGY
jgi:predicted lipoprotein with Yx(FWY)xxD motif